MVGRKEQDKLIKELFEDDELDVLQGADWPNSPALEQHFHVRRFYYVVFFFLLTVLFSIGLVRVYHESETGLIALERMVPPAQRTTRVGDLVQSRSDRELAEQLGITLEELYTTERVIERLVTAREDRRLGPLDWGLSVRISEYRVVFSYRIFLNMAISAIISWALYIRARDRAASVVIAAQNNRLLDLNKRLESKVTEAQRLLTELQAMQSKLVQAQKLASIGRMSATLAHEIRNPMSIIMSAAGMAAEDIPAGSPPAEAVDLIRSEVARLDRIITELLNFARPKPPRLEPHNVTTLVDSWIAPLVDDFGDMGIKLEKQLDARLPEVTADADQLYQVFLNVMWNARDAVRENDGGRILVSTEAADNGSADLVIRDDGPGMEKEIIAQIFEPFFTRKTTGSGLGLPVVQQLMEGMGGGVEIESELERGTTVRLHLRRADA